VHQAEIFNNFHTGEKGISKIVKILLLLTNGAGYWRGDDVNDRGYPETDQVKSEG
jgi:hypothetical protein